MKNCVLHYTVRDLVGRSQCKALVHDVVYTSVCIMINYSARERAELVVKLDLIHMIQQEERLALCIFWPMHS